METKQEEKYPFKVSIDEEIDWDGVFVKIEFSNTVSQTEREKLEDRIWEWADKGFKDGYEEGKIDLLLEDELEWDEEGKQTEFFVDMTGASEKTLEALFDKLTSFGAIKEIKVGSGYER